jgi:uncharacterized membrane protein
MLSIVNAYPGIIMATIFGDYIPKNKISFFNPLGFIADMAADLLLTIGFAVITIAFIYLPQLNGNILRAAFGVGMVLFVPGYALVAALFPGRNDTGRIERAALSFALSIAMVPLIGLILNYTPWGVRLDPTVACVTILTVACALVANKRRHDIPKEDRFYIDFRGLYNTISYKISTDKTGFDKALTAITIIALLLTTALSAYILVLPEQGHPYTEFYLLGPDGKTENYPYRYILGDGKMVIVGISNHEHRNMTYDLAISLNDLNNSTAINLYSEQLALPDNEVWEKAINITPEMAGINMKMDFLLYADGNMSAPYKECYLWVNVTTPTPRPTLRPIVRPTVWPTPIPIMNPFSNVSIPYI